jgi:SAM-dependent methyltransferase
VESTPGREHGLSVDPDHFFEHYNSFVKSSDTGRWLQPDTELRRLNARYRVLIHANGEVLAGAQVVDLGSHDGRFSFAALQHGAERVVGIELKPRLTRRAAEHMAFYDVPPDRYAFITGDFLDGLDAIPQCDVVLCFGVLYHVNDHMRLLAKIAELQPRWLIIDTNVSLAQRAVIEFHNSEAGPGEPSFPPPPGSQLEGYPSKAGLDAMLSSFGWTSEYFDWASSGLSDPDADPQPGRARDIMDDYACGRRVSLVVKCNERYPREMIDRAVQEIAERYPGVPRSFKCIEQVASDYGMSPQALAVWVRKSEREESRRASAVTSSEA